MSLKVAKSMDLRTMRESFGAAVERRPTLWRWLLGGPIGFVIAVLNMAGLPLVLPSGASDVNHVVLPVFMFPLLWTAYIVIPAATQNLGRWALIYLGLLLLFSALVLGQLTL